ncbi:PLDc N-terminal domain-containing protein [Litoribrevibacter albus]|uniref:Cardiolipin synthase N-terminal domain-containing protein n=1 Tax=Litoribrevibacter albus TaxID=1473156 RepID=A0AA37S9W7_9GAMM|nr:PLDc N-terminal domain-containing protein [Litoribrevibacter albus]GLQ31089.1 hypothetical protein GCM10007876_15680 [Litoribrevibacter albus]
MPIFILSILIQVCFVIHVVKTGRSTTWIWIIVMLPLAGSIAYFILEVYPELASSRTGRKAGNKVQSVLNPNKDLNEAAKNYSIAPTVHNTIALAEECLEKGMFQQAKDLYSKGLTGVHQSDPELLFGIAKADFGLKSYTDVKETLDKLIDSNPDYKNQDAHLLYARALEQLKDAISARHEYEALHQYYTGPEATFYYALFLKSQGEKDKAKELLSGILQKAKQSGRYFNDLYKDLIRQAKDELSR